jgi:hypothetical protein
MLAKVGAVRHPPSIKQPGPSPVRGRHHRHRAPRRGALHAVILGGLIVPQALLRDRYGVQPADRDSEISVGPIGAEDAELLGLPLGLNVLLYRSVMRDAAGVPVETVSSVNHPQRVVFSTQSAHIRV